MDATVYEDEKLLGLEKDIKEMINKKEVKKVEEKTKIQK